MKRAAIAALTLAVLLLTGCGTGASTEAPAVTEYADEYFSVTRQGAYTSIVDTTTGAEYHFISRRVKRPQNATEAAERARLKTTASTDTLTIRTAGNVILVDVHASGETYLFRG